jgi:hypothetical protein
MSGNPADFAEGGMAAVPGDRGAIRTMNTEIMVPGHPRWCEFLSELGKAQRCTRTTDHAERLLSRMQGIDLHASLFALHELGGKCDCAILFDLLELDDPRVSA